MGDLNLLVTEFNEVLSEGTSTDAFNRTKGIIDEMVKLTSDLYNSKTLNYAKLRNDTPSEENKCDIFKTLNFVSRETKERTKILDAGAGHGRDLVFLNSLENIEAIGIDNSTVFFDMLKHLEENGALPKNSCYFADIRNLNIFSESEFDVVRHNASLLHLPITNFEQLGVNAVLSETRRVLKKDGMAYIRVKEGNGFVSVDSGDGMGERCFQFYSESLLRKILTEYGFDVVDITKRKGKKERKDDVVWISAYAYKRGV